jgi:hypothetical protein
MGTSGNPAKKAAAKASVSSAADFKKRKKGAPLLLPSGLVMVCKRVGLESFLAQGDVPNPLIPIVEQALAKGQSADVNAIIGNTEGGVDVGMIREMLTMVNTVVVSVSIEPKVHEVPEDDEEDRDDDLLYVDEIDEEDKMFLFQWTIGGTDDVAQFRREAEEGLVALAEGASSGSAAQ